MGHSRSCEVAVIGAGAAGLVAGRELRREGHKVVVFEKGESVGGTWVYSSSVESDQLGLDPCRKIVHSSLYQSLRVNNPRECIGFFDYPFVPRPSNKERDSRRFPEHTEVLLYLQDFAREFELMDLLRFGTEVFDVHLEDEGRWMVRSRKVRMDGCDDSVADDSEIFDAVVVCNGHYTEPRIAEIPGIKVWPGKQIHSHNYRVPEPFQDQVVVLIGSSHSAFDISRDICAFAKEVHLSSRSAPDKQPMSKQPGYDNMWLHSMIERAHADGTVAFRDGSSVRVDIILHCTGYKYDFPFLKVNDIVTVDDNCVGPLYKHIFPPLLAPWLSFIGLPWRVIPFPLCEMQSKWVASVLSGRLALPSQEEMMMDVEAFYSKLDAAGLPKHYTHNMSDYQSYYSYCYCRPLNGRGELGATTQQWKSWSIAIDEIAVGPPNNGTTLISKVGRANCDFLVKKTYYQFDYVDELATVCGHPTVEEWRKQMLDMNKKNRGYHPNSYRDEWDDHSLVLQAYEDFHRYPKS